MAIECHGNMTSGLKSVVNDFANKGFDLSGEACGLDDKLDRFKQNREQTALLNTNYQMVNLNWTLFWYLTFSSLDMSFWVIV